MTLSSHSTNNAATAQTPTAGNPSGLRRRCLRSRRRALLDERAQLRDCLGVPGATAAQHAVVLEAALASQFLALARHEAHVAVFVDVIPRRLLGDVRELDGEALAQQLVDQRLNTAWVVVPPPSVHVRAILERDHWRILVVGEVQLVVDFVLGVGAGHG